MTILCQVSHPCVIRPMTYFPNIAVGAKDKCIGKAISIGMALRHMTVNGTNTVSQSTKNEHPPTNPDIHSPEAENYWKNLNCLLVATNDNNQSYFKHNLVLHPDIILVHYFTMDLVRPKCQCLFFVTNVWRHRASTEMANQYNIHQQRKNALS